MASLTSANPAAADPLAQLHDLHLPASVAAWPPAPGWWLVAALLITVIVVSVYRVSQNRRRNRYRRLAQQELQQLLQQLPKSAPPAQQLAALNNLLKRVALIAYPNTPVARLSGKAWAEFLVAHCPSLSVNDFVLLSQGPYQSHHSAHDDQYHRDLHHLTTNVQLWIKHHRPPVTTRGATH